MHAHGQRWDDPGPRGPLSHHQRRGVPSQSPRGPPWATVHADVISAIAHQNSLGDKIGARERLQELIAILGSSFSHRLHRLCGISPLTNPSRAQPHHPHTAHGWNLAQWTDIRIMQGHIAAGGEPSARSLATTLANRRPSEMRSRFYLICNLLEPIQGTSGSA